MKKTKIYLISDGTFIKIGITSNIRKRIKNLQTGNPNKLKVIFTYYVDNAEQLEMELHKKFKRKRKAGEWFDLTDDDVMVARNVAMGWSRRES